MSKEILDLVDTSIKIGLGAVISGITTYFITRINYKNSLSKEQRDHSRLLSKERRDFKARIAEQSLESIDPFLTNLSDYISLVDGLLRSGKPQNYEKITSVVKAIDDLDEALIASRSNYDLCLSKLNLIGFYNTTEKLKLFLKMENEIRDSVIFQRKLPDRTLLDEYGSGFVELKNEFLSSLNTEFEKLFEENNYN
ncbi:hypothetical protein [Pseudoalteromonas apostichopi]|uniref:hypothetical protein n=1 Tax=Pseudoalteromonas apostichopi TaxID=3035452 RepID=UPI002573057C|nr:hypothetical protein [Pseudoalteromonas sp. FE4]